MRKKYSYAILLICCFLIVSIGLIKGWIRRPELVFSVEEAFQEEAFSLELENGLFEGEIYYTLDGNTPTLESSCYQEPIWIPSSEYIQATVVKAAVCKNGKLGTIYTKTYFVGEGVKDLDVMFVSLSIDEEALYDEKTGILANYEESGENGEWDRAGYVEFYDEYGELMLKQGTGVAVSGHGSRRYEQKSFKLTSSDIYDKAHPTFEYDFFEADMAGNQTGQSYNRLVLRNGGTDHKGTMIRWNVVSRLGKESGILCAGARPGILFLNGTYYGLIQLQEKYTRYNIAAAIGAQKDDIEKYEPNEINSARFGGYYNRLHSDLNDIERQEKLESSVDIEDMLLHYAVNIIMNNNDWPFHNFLSWKCADTGTSSYSDGRVRFFLYDLDAVYQNNVKSEIKNIFDYLMEEPLEDATDTFSILMKSDKYRTMFVNLVCELLSTVYEEEHVLQIIEEENQKIAHVIEVYYTEEEQTRQSEAVQQMKAEVQKSYERVKEGLEKHLGASNAYTLQVIAPDNTGISFSQIQVEAGETYIGEYYHNYPLTLTAKLAEGESFSHWLVNGREIYEPQLLLDESYQDENLQITVVMKEN